MQSDGGFGYFPGRNQQIAIDTAEMSGEDALVLENLVNSARFFEQPEALRTPGAADYRSYSITVRDGDRSHTISVSDPVHDPAIQALIDYLGSRHHDTGGAASPS